MTQDEFDAAIAQKAIENVQKDINFTVRSNLDYAKEALRLSREGWRPEPKVDPAMAKALTVLFYVNDAWGRADKEHRDQVAAKVIADAIAQAVADARVKVPADVRRTVENCSHPALAHLDSGKLAAFISTLIAAEDGQ